jgi:hypothetical protein
MHEDFEALSKKDRKRITSAVDKQFVDLDDIKPMGNITLRGKRLSVITYPEFIQSLPGKILDKFWINFLSLILSLKK